MINNLIWTLLCWLLTFTVRTAKIFQPIHQRNYIWSPFHHCSFTKDSCPVTHVGNFKPHQSNLEDVLVSAVCLMHPKANLSIVLSNGCWSFTIFIRQSFSKLLLGLAVLHKPWHDLLFLSLLSVKICNQPLYTSRDEVVWIPKPTIRKCPFNPLSLWVHVCLHHFSDFGHCFFFLLRGKIVSHSVAVEVFALVGVHSGTVVNYRVARYRLDHCFHCFLLTAPAAE